MPIALWYSVLLLGGAGGGGLKGWGCRIIPISLHRTECVLTFSCETEEPLFYPAQIFIVISPEIFKFSYNGPNSPFPPLSFQSASRPSSLALHSYFIWQSCGLSWSVRKFAHTANLAQACPHHLHPLLAPVCILDCGSGYHPENSFLRLWMAGSH